MRVANLIIPGIIWPKVADLNYILPPKPFPYLAKLMARAQLTHHQFAYSDIVYYSGFRDKDLSLAHNYAQSLGLPLPGNYWLVEPTHLRADGERFLIADSPILQLTQAAAKLLLTNLNAHFNVEGIYFYYIHEHLWLLQLASPLENLKTVPIVDIIGEDIHNYLPFGNNQLRIHSLLNEIQMLLYTQKLNQEREGAGLIPINSLWLWNKQLPNLPDSLRVINYPVAGAGAAITKQLRSISSALLIDKAYFAACYEDSCAWAKNLSEIDNEIIQPLFHSLSYGNFAQLNLWIPSRETTLQLAISRMSLYKFWRKATYKSIIRRWNDSYEL